MREGYTFDAWYVDQALSLKYTFDTMPAESVTLFAKWLVNPYTLSFNSNGGSTVSQVTYDINETVTIPSVPVRDGYTFNGWYSDEALTLSYTFNKMPSRDLTLYAKWTIKTLTITFETDGGSLVTPLSQDFETSVLEPSVPTKTGHTFKGWYKDSSLNTIYTFPKTMTSEDITLYAKFDVNRYQISFVGEGYVTFKKVLNGNSFGARLSTSNEVYTWGFNGNGRLGLGDDVNRLTPTKVSLPLLEGEVVTDIALTGYSVTVVTSLHRVFGWGGATTWNLQLNEKENLSPVEIPLGLLDGEEILDISHDHGNYTIMILTTSRLLGWGYNINGQLGLPKTSSSPNHFTDVQEIPMSFLLPNEEVTKLYANGGSHILITNLGNVYAAGSFSNIALNSETFVKLNIPLNANEVVTDLMITPTTLVVFTNQNRLLGIGRTIGDGTDNYYNSYQVLNYPLEAGESIVSLLSGFRSLGYLTNLGNLYTFGNGNATGTGKAFGDDIFTPTKITQNFNLEAGDRILSVSLGNTGGSVSTQNGYLYGLVGGLLLEPIMQEWMYYYHNKQHA